MNIGDEPASIDVATVAAFSLGRTLARLKYFAVQRWLRSLDGEVELVDCFQQLLIQVRDLVAAQDKDPLQSKFRRVIDHWNNALESEWRAEWLLELEAAIQSDEFDQRRHELTGTVDGFISRLTQMIVERLDPRGVISLSLGVCLEQGLCRGDVANFVYGEGRGDCGRRQLRNPTCLGWSQTSSQSADNRCDNSVNREYYGEGDLPPPDGWAQELTQRWVELGLTPQAFPEDISSALVGMTRGKRKRVMMDFERLFAELVSQSAPSSPGYLGLVLNRSQLSVRRQDFEVTVSFAGRLGWELVWRFYKKGDAFVDREELKQLWIKHGRAKNPARGTIDNQISEVNNQLVRLGVTIECRRGHGWKLVAADPPNRLDQANSPSQAITARNKKKLPNARRSSGKRGRLGNPAIKPVGRRTAKRA